MKRTILISLIVGALLAACSPSSQPTPTSVPPTPASTIVIKGKGVAVTVPDTYVSENPEILGNPELYVLYAYDTKPAQTEILTNFNIAVTPLPSEEITLESQIPSIVDTYEKDMSATDIETKNCVYGNNECVECTFTVMQEGKTLRMLQYWVKEGANVYALTFGTDISEFPQRYDEFSQIFNSFQILEE